ELRIAVAPVRRQCGERSVPGAGERRAVDNRPRLSLARAHELEPPADALSVEPLEQALHEARRGPGAVARGEEAQHLLAPAGVQRPEKPGSTITVAGVLDRQPQPRVAPALRKRVCDLLPLPDQAHEPEHKLKAKVAKVEKKGAVSEELLREFFREMLLIRRFEEKVEERFRAGDLPGFLHVAVGQEACAVGVCRALEE